MFSANRLASIALTAGVLAAAAVAGYAVFFRGSAAPSRASQAPTAMAAVPPPTPTVADDVAGDRDRANATISTSAPALAQLIAVVESSNVDSLMANHLNWTSSPCTPPGQTSNTVSPCATLGVPVGTVVRMLPEDVGEAWWHPEQDVRAAFDYYLGATHPSLGLVAKKDDGSYLVSFAIDSVRVPGQNAVAVRITFRTDPANPGLVAVYGVGLNTSTPLDTIRTDEHYGETPMYDVIYISPRLAAADQAWHDQIAAHAHDTPTSNR